MSDIMLQKHWSLIHRALLSGNNYSTPEYRMRFVIAYGRISQLAYGKKQARRNINEVSLHFLQVTCQLLFPDASNLCLLSLSVRVEMLTNIYQKR
jgi:hypothetical protein